MRAYEGVDVQVHSFLNSAIDGSNLSTWHLSYSANVNLQAPCVLYAGQAFRYSPENAFYMCNQQIHSLTIMYWDRGYRIKLEQKTWVLSVFYSKYIPSVSIQQVARSNKDWKDLCTSSCGMARRLDVTAAWMSWTSSNRRPFNGNFSLGNIK